jgi:hypothetical protein
METYFEIMTVIFMLMRFIIARAQAERKRVTYTATTSSYAAMKIVKLVTRRDKMKLNFTRRIKNMQPLFSGHYIDAKALYVLYFDKIPSVCFIGSVDATKVSEYINEKFRAEMVAVYQHVYFDHDKRETMFNNALFVLTDNRIVEVAIGYVHVLCEPKALTEVNELMKALAEFKMAQVSTYQTQVVGFARQSEMT